jgi:hypothetical protein
MKSFRSLAVCLIVLMLLAVCFVPVCFAVDAAKASDAISQAERDLGSAYAAVAEAEGAGANVSALLDKLNAGGVFLSEAHSAFEIGDYGGAFSSAVACSGAVGGVVDDAARLKENAGIAHNAVLLLTAVVSGIGVGVLLVCAFIFWRFLKRWYFRRVLEMKPEGAVVQ